MKKINTHFLMMLAVAGANAALWVCIIWVVRHFSP